MGGAFVSHASEDAAIARAAVTWLEAHGHPCWIAPRDIEPGDDYAQSIVRAVESAESLIFFLSRASASSQHCRSELEMAKSGALPIVPVLLDDTVPTGGLRFFLSTHQWLDTRGVSAATWHQRLGAALEVAAGAPRELRPPAGDPARPRRRRHWALAGAVLTVLALGVVAALVTSGDEPGEVGPGKVVWRANIETGTASPVVSGRTVFIAGTDAHLYALEEATGEELWRYELSAPAGATPLVTADTVYVGATDGVVLAIDRESHAQRWSFSAGGAVATTPGVSGSEIVFGSDDGAVYALDAATGEVRWRSFTDAAVQSGPAVGHGKVFAGNTVGNLMAFDTTANGSQVWSEPITTPLPSSPTALGDLVLIGGSDGVLYAYDTDGEPAWSFPEDRQGLTRLPDRVLTATVSKGIVLAPGRNGVLYALDGVTGRPRWAAPFTTDKGISSRVVAVDGVAYVAGAAGDVYALDLTTGAERWRAETDTRSDTAPAVSKSLVVVATAEGDVYALQR